MEKSFPKSKTKGKNVFEILKQREIAFLGAKFPLKIEYRKNQNTEIEKYSIKKSEVEK